MGSGLGDGEGLGDGDELAAAVGVGGVDELVVAAGVAPSSLPQAAVTDRAKAQRTSRIDRMPWECRGPSAPYHRLSSGGGRSTGTLALPQRDPDHGHPASGVDRPARAGLLGHGLRCPTVTEIDAVAQVLRDVLAVVDAGDQDAA